MISANPEFLKFLIGDNGERVTQVEDFKPFAEYIPEGDCLEFFVKPDPYFGERIDELVTVYVSKESGEVVGSLIKGVRKFCKEIIDKYPGFVIEIQDGPLKLVHLFRAHAWANVPSGHPENAEHICKSYRKLIQIAEENETTLPDNLCLTA